MNIVAVNLLDARSLLTAFGVVGIFVVLFAETGLLVGFFLPGDSLLFTAGLLSSVPGATAVPLPLPWVLLAAAGGALAGAQVGYLIGRRAGPALTDRARRPRVATAMARSQQLLDRYGQGRAIVLARFIPFVRTVLNPVAGALAVPVWTFTAWQIAGGLVWSVGLVIAGFLLGRSVPGIDQYLLPLVALIVVVSLIPLALELLRARRRGRRARGSADREPTRVMVVDDDGARRARLTALLEGAADIHLVGTASSTGITLAVLDVLGPDRPDVMLVEPHRRDQDGTATAAILSRYPDITVWIHADDATHPLAVRELAAGAAGVLAHQTGPDQLLAVLRSGEAAQDGGGLAGR